MSATMVMAATSPLRRTPHPKMNTGSDVEFQRAVSHFLAIKDQSFSVSGSVTIPETDPLILFFRTSSGISHSLSFPLKTDIMHQLPALNVLLVACETTPDVAFDAALPIADNVDQELPLVWPPTLPFSVTFDLANHPILDTIRSVLFPNCYPGTYLYAIRNKLEIFLAGAHSEPRRPSSSRGVDGAKQVATIIVTLPVRFHGGALAVRNPEGVEERFYQPTQPQGSSGDTLLHWTAFTADCEHEIEFVEQGCRMSISYGVYIKTFGPAGPRPNPLFTPNDQLLEALSPLLNICRGRTLGIYLTGRYSCSPTDVLADSLVPSLKGSDAALYHALRLYKLTPELRWAAGGYIWPVDKTVHISTYVEGDRFRSQSRPNINNPYSAPNSPLQGPRAARQRRRSVSRSAASYEAGSSAGGIGMTGVGTYAHGSRSVIIDSEENEDEEFRDLVMEGGAILLQEMDIVMLTPRDQSVSREKLTFMSRGTLDRLYVNILLLVYVQ